MFAHHALGAVEVERSFMRALAKSLGFPPRARRCEEGAGNPAYIAHLQSVARGGSLGEIVAAVLPCYWIYGEVGKHLYKNRPRKPIIFRKWIEICASEEFLAAGA